HQVYGAIVDATGSLARGWFATGPGFFTALAAVSIEQDNVAVHGIGMDQHLYTAIFEADSGTLLSGWTAPTAGRFSAVAAKSHPEGRVGASIRATSADVFAILAGDGSIVGDTFDARGALASAFFAAGPGFFP